MKQKVAVIGANGFTGRRVLECLGKRDCYQLTASSFRQDLFPAEGYEYYPMDITDPISVDLFFANVRPDVIINCAALSVPDYCEIHHEEAFLLNVAAVERLAKFAEQQNTQFIHLSTDFVFDGTGEALYQESDLPDPVNYYGKTKYLGELAALSNCQKASIARVSVVYGQAYDGQHGNIVKLVKDRLSKGEPIRVVSDQYRTPTWVSDIAYGLDLMIRKEARGIYHICGAEHLSVAEIAFRTADFFELDHSLICPVTTAEMNEKTKRPLKSGLSIEKARTNLEYIPHTLEEGMKEMINA